MADRADHLGDRMKEYERRETSRCFLPMLPIYARIDGRSFSSFTAGMDRPYDTRLIAAMIETTKGLVESTQARIGYTQSDEISLVWLTESYDGGVFFEGKITKMTSVLSSLATAYFTRSLRANNLEAWEDKLPHFDCRVFQLPNRTEAANVFLWRELDATKNAIGMAARAVYPHADVDGKTGSEKQEMLFAKGINFNDYPSAFKRGTFIRREVVDRLLTAEELRDIPQQYRPEPGTLVTRTRIQEMDMPKFSTVLNRVEVIFDNAVPLVTEVRANGNQSENDIS